MFFEQGKTINEVHPIQSFENSMSNFAFQLIWAKSKLKKIVELFC